MLRKVCMNLASSSRDIESRHLFRPKKLVSELLLHSSVKASVFVRDDLIMTMAVSEHFFHTRPSIGYRFIFLLREGSNFSEKSVKKSWGKESANESGSKFILCFYSSFVELIQPCFASPVSDRGNTIRRTASFLVDNSRVLKWIVSMVEWNSYVSLTKYLIQKTDAFLALDSIPPYIDNAIYDSKGDILYLGNLLKDELLETEKSDTFLIGDEGIKFNPLKDIYNPVLIPRVFETPMDFRDLISKTFDMTIPNPLFDFHSKFTLNSDNPIFDIQN
uniref:Uncharacterized protein n=1 Tax=Tanacetum cinerariifolium TaxID=118510 RepID=A0A6L2KNW9_TANCI|nr:hypothetical protein [Tanacetum cinerariifolium]